MFKVKTKRQKLVYDPVKDLWWKFLGKKLTSKTY